jgi:hypothetical protein
MFNNAEVILVKFTPLTVARIALAKEKNEPLKFKITALILHPFVLFLTKFQYAG